MTPAQTPGTQQDTKRVQCPDCPDGSVWTSKGPTEEICPTCRGHAFVWRNVKENEDGE